MLLVSSCHCVLSIILRPLCFVHYIEAIVFCALYWGHCVLCIILRPLCFVHFIEAIVFCALYWGHCVLCIILRPLCFVHYIEAIVFCALYWGHCVLCIILRPLCFVHYIEAIVFCALYWGQVLSGEWRCSWSNADRWCSNYIWVINNLIAYLSATYIRDLTVLIHASLQQHGRIITLHRKPLFWLPIHSLV